ncbi:hypothetical protein AWM75_03350 [Aerococcus urinaehominis]|uniref:Signal peptidase I n=1 Tax=Aerococcus urinaehominis TaxID=128944 RepID=A0A0X8FKQ6_9LACT|nr:signal peptidase I [Aerococcus urinaehominis]AMB99095.1 hypothetical protein AWM75_03350 [Aerococcus urinaehominis]SDM03466.1 signal peptidase I [Aerococcus urinaehominis]
MKNNWMKELLINVLIVVVTFAAVFLLFKYVAGPVRVSGQSMESSFQDGDRLLDAQLTDISHFDVVVFDAPDGSGDKYIKRVIGLPGDHIAFKNDVLYLNGQPYEEPYIDKSLNPTDGPNTFDFDLAQLTGSSQVPEGKAFVMGDNRQNSNDSRYFGFIDLDQLSEIKYEFWPTDDFGSVPNYEIQSGQIVAE